MSTSDNGNKSGNGNGVADFEKWQKTASIILAPPPEAWDSLNNLLGQMSGRPNPVFSPLVSEARRELEQNPEWAQQRIIFNKISNLFIRNRGDVEANELFAKLVEHTRPEMLKPLIKSSISRARDFVGPSGIVNSWALQQPVISECLDLVDAVVRAKPDYAPRILAIVERIGANIGPSPILDHIRDRITPPQPPQPNMRERLTNWIGNFKHRQGLTE